MKNILTFLLFACGFAALQAQNCAVQIQETNVPTSPHSLEAFATPANLPVKYEWNTGETTAKIFPKQSGDYCVTATNSNGCISNACRTVVVNGGACSAQISYDSVHNVVTAHASGAAPFTYTWSSGLGNQPHVVLPAGVNDVCVTVTDATGCQAKTCFSFQPHPTCIVKISTLTSAGAGINLTANFAPSSPTTPTTNIWWSNGAQTLTTTVFHPGVYCVTVEDASGCTATACQDIHNITKLDVNVSTTNSTNVDAEIFLITYDTAQGGILTAVATANTDQFGFAQFQNIPSGNYLVKAALRPSSPDYDKFLPTYFEQNLFWSGATTVGMGALSPSIAPQSIKFSLIPGQNPGGPGFIGGLVVQGANLVVHDDRGEGDPIPGVQIILEKNGVAFAATKTAANGKFSFDNLPYGTYKISIDIPGIPTASTTVELTAAKPEVTTANFKVDDDSAVFTAVEDPAFEGLFVAPNPTHDILKINLPAQKFDLVLANLQGQILMQTFDNQSAVQVDLQNLLTGVYLLQIRNGSKIHTEKVLKF